MSAYNYDAIFGTTTFRQVRSTNFSSDVQTIVDRKNGSVDADLIAILSAEPKLSLESGDISSVISALGMQSGKQIYTAHASENSFTIPFMHAANMGAFGGASAHTTITGTNALILPTQFSASHQDQGGATASLDVGFFSSDGLTDPIAFNSGQTLAASAYTGTHTIGPVAINGAQLNKVTQITVNTGLTMEFESYNGVPYPLEVFINPAVDPTISVTFADFDALNAYDSLFVSLTSAAAYFRKFDASSGTVYADASANHVRFSFAAGLSVLQDASAQAQQRGTPTLVLQGKTLTATDSQTISI